MFDSLQWSVMRKKNTPRGIWCRLRHFESQREVWVGSIYIAPHYSVADVTEQTTKLLNALPSTTLPCFLTGDANAGIRWSADVDDVVAVGTDAKGRTLLDVLVSQGYCMCPHQQHQLCQPTSRPRKEGAVGRIIDWVACKHVHTGRVHVQTDSFAQIGTDHDALTLVASVRVLKPKPRKIRLGPRVVTKPLPQVTNLDYDKLCQLAKEYTSPTQTHAYRDDAVVKGLFPLLCFVPRARLLRSASTTPSLPQP